MDIQTLYTLFLQHPEVCTDTRKLKPGCMFFALKGGNFNGNNFAQQALDGGAAFVVADEERALVSDKCILVSDVLQTLQALAHYHRKQLNIPVIAVVGSNGKTTTKELLAAVLSQKYSLLHTPGNFNNHIGLPLTLLMLNNSHQLAVIEMGANHEKENALLCEIACPSHGLVTNNGKDHLEGFGSMEGVIRSNAELYDYFAANGGTAFVNAGDAVLMERSEKVKHRVLYGQQRHPGMQDGSVCITASQLQPHIQFTLEDCIIESVLSGDYNFDNLLAAVAAGLHFGVPATSIKAGIEGYRPQNLRSQLIEKEQNNIFLDAYNANPSSMEVSLRNFAAMPGTNKLAILGDMFELGKYEAEEHQLLASHCEKLGFETWLVGPAFSRTSSVLRKFEDTTAVITFLKEQPLHNRFVFLKGSRGMKMESLVDFL